MTSTQDKPPASAPTKNTRSRGWCFTICNYDDNDVLLVKALTEACVAVIAAYEVAPDTGTPHIQGYVYYTNQRSFMSMKKALPRAHYEAALGTGDQNVAYCSKEGNVFLKEGVFPKAGKRTDIESLYEQLRNGANMREIMGGDSTPNLQCIQIAEKWLKTMETERDWMPEVKFFFGPPGAGKTRAARAWLGEDTYTCNRTTSKFWDGYDAHQGVLIDDFRADWCKFVELLGITDRYAYRVETKGGARQLLARKIAITSPHSPEETFVGSSENLEQLLGRITEIHELTGAASRRLMPKRFVDGAIISPTQVNAEGCLFT
uniref:Replication-associated protein n=1 Tax=Cressdnaviricota sp. TaxID=2748378 RepID=A0A6M3YS10_9VIRU|nr:MAG: replication-associated protein [Cressdnaviricota sp.]